MVNQDEKNYDRKKIWDIVELGYEDPKDWNDLQGNDRRIKKEAENKNSMALFHVHIQRRFERIQKILTMAMIKLRL